MASVGRAASTILARHAYPEIVSILQAEALALVACLSSTLKFDGVFTLQAKGDGPVRTLFADITETGALRGYAALDDNRAVLQTAAFSHDPTGPVRLGHIMGDGYIAFTVDDTEAAHQRLNSEGFSPQKPVDLRRPIQLANGVEGEVAFTVLRVPPDCMEEGRIQILRQETPDLVWREDLIARENGLSALQGILIAVFDPENAVDRFSRFTGKIANGKNGHFNIDLDRGQISIVSEKKCLELLPQIEIPALPYMAAVILESENLSKTKFHLFLY